MSYEIWTAHRYGHQFGQPENKLADELTEKQTAERLGELVATGPHLLHNLLVIDGDATWRASKWLTELEDDSAQA